jgi:hypothetical protein
MRFGMVFFVVLALISVPLIFLVIGLFMLPLALSGIFLMRKGIKGFKVQIQIYEKFLSVSSSLPDPVRYQI